MQVCGYGLIVAAFTAPEDGEYSISNLGVRRVTTWGEESSLKVFDKNKNLVTAVIGDSTAWTHDNNVYNMGVLYEGEKIYFAVDNEDTFVGDATEITWTVNALLGAAHLNSIDVTWNSWDTAISDMASEAIVEDAVASISAVLDLYESDEEDQVYFGTELASYSATLHSEPFNNVSTIRSRIPGDYDKEYPYIAKSNVGRGLDYLESGYASPSGVFDMQMHPPDNQHLIVAAFNVPLDGYYSISNLAARRVTTWGEESSLKVFDQNESLVATVPTDSAIWSLDNNTYSLGELEKGDRIYIAVDDEDTFVGDATEITWSIKGLISPLDLPNDTSYYFVNGELLAKRNADNSMHFFHNDHLGSTNIVTDENGDLVEATRYDPWGVVLSGGTLSKFLYTGQEHDSETGLHYYNARYYNSEIRRFTQPDVYVQNIYDPQMLNRYSYVRNNPLKYTDPSGHFIGSIFNTVKTWVSILTSKPQSQASNNNNSSSNNTKSSNNNCSCSKPPTSSQSSNNGGSSNNNGGGNVLGDATKSVKSTADNLANKAVSHVNNSYRNGHIDVGGSFGLFSVGPIFLNVGGGIKFNEDEYVPYGSIGPGVGGGGGSVIFSDESINGDSTVSIQSTIPVFGDFGPAFNIDYPASGAPVKISSGKLNIGVGYSGGISVMYNHNFGVYNR